MISPDLAPSAPGPVQARCGARPADGLAPERAFAEFIEGAPAEVGKAEAGPSDLIALLDAAAPLATPAPALPAAPAAPAAALIAAALSSPVASLPNFKDGAPTGADRDVPAPSAPEPGHALTPTVALPEAPGAKTATPSVAGIALESGAASPAEARGESEADPETAVRVPSASAAPGAPLAAVEARPIAAPAAPLAFDLALQPASAQSWRLSALSAQAAREPAPPPSPRDVAGQITVAIAQSSQPHVEIRLDPPELGRVQIRLNLTETGLQAVVLAERPETQEFLRRHAEVLVRDLTDAGYAQLSLEFAAGGEAAPRDAPADEQGASASFEASAAPVPVREVPLRVAAGGLDIRL